MTLAIFKIYKKQLNKILLELSYIEYF